MQRTACFVHEQRVVASASPQFLCSRPPAAGDVKKNMRIFCSENRNLKEREVRAGQRM